LSIIDLSGPLSLATESKNSEKSTSLTGGRLPVLGGNIPRGTSMKKKGNHQVSLETAPKKKRKRTPGGKSSEHADPPLRKKKSAAPELSLWWGNFGRRPGWKKLRRCWLGRNTSNGDPKNSEEKFFCFGLKDHLEKEISR